MLFIFSFLSTKIFSIIFLYLQNSTLLQVYPTITINHKKIDEKFPWKYFVFLTNNNEMSAFLQNDLIIFYA